MSQYIDLCTKIVEHGIWVENERTGKKCLTLINADMEYKAGEFPLDTTRKSFWKAAVAEMLGYIRGYDSAAQFRAIGSPTWDANANENQAWLDNYHRKGTDDMGRVYGVQGRGWQTYQKLESASLRDDTSVYRTSSIDQLKKVIDNLTNDIDDRGEIITFWNPGEFDQGCLRPCMHTHTFSLLGDTLYLTSYQRSCDFLLGGNFNMVQVYFLLAIVAQITGKKMGTAYHKIINAHIYEDQYDVLMESKQLEREPFDSPTFHINPQIKSLEDLETWVTVDDFWVEDYQHHDPIKYPFSV
ncbi:thymidylate synthase [Vibrio phage 2.275.O._10N.286.54.E11]|nr:thymidylate synthase [Vibrio phage 2.275.O._10N.286.54.E11]